MKSIPLTQGKVAIVDDEDFEALSAMKWYFNKGYACRKVTVATNNRLMLYLHRFLFGLNKGEKLQVDHINGDTLDNRRANLRVCTSGQNGLNKGLLRNNPTGYKGVIERKGKYCAFVNFNRKQYYLGSFNTPEEANIVAVRKREELHGEFVNHGMPPDSYVAGESDSADKCAQAFRSLSKKESGE
jgi:hypothetical protein